MYVLGTAGHIDHGKSALVQALTGMDPDRLREEKERGMTLDLGFAWLKLPSGREVGIVDVPGHERFVRNMLAGVGGIDLALLVIAANEGVMPQTREHLAIINLLEIQKGVVAMTKKDLVEPDWLELVKMDVEDTLKPTTLRGAPVIAVSSVTREGLPELVAAIDELLRATPPKKDIGRPRLPIDRVFTIAGSGTIVTGTLIDGALTVGQNVEVIPGALKSRLRGLQTHKAQVTTATPGSRVAANLVGITTAELSRGQVLTSPGWLEPSLMVTARLRLLEQPARPLRHNGMVGFHTGAAETMARVRVLEKDLVKPGESAWVQFDLLSPVALVTGDHYIIRSTTETLGGGKIIEAHTQRLRRHRPEIIEKLAVREKGAVDDAVLAAIENTPLEFSAIKTKIDLPEPETKSILDNLVRDGRAVRLGAQEPYLYLSRAGWQQVAEKARMLVQEYHRKNPLRTGMPGIELAGKLGLRGQAASVVARLAEEGVLAGDGLSVWLPGREVKLNPAQQAKIDAFLNSLAKNPYAPPADLVPDPDLLNLLVERGQVVKVSEGVVFSSGTYREIVDRILAELKAKGKITLAEARDLFGTSRKYAQAILEHLDEQKITRRVGDERVLWKE